MRPSHNSVNKGFGLARWQKRWVYGVSSCTFLTGVAWLLLYYFVRIEGDFGLEQHPAAPLILAAHAAAGFFSVWLLGLLWMPHIFRAWTFRRNRITGSVVVILFAVLIFSGWLLYYASNEALREWTSIVHWGVGLSGLFLLPLHIWQGRKLTRLAVKAEHTQ